MCVSRLTTLPALLLLAAASAFALPRISIDIDPSTPGVQSVLRITGGEAPFVDVVISGAGVLMPVQGFQFHLGFDPAVLSAISAVDGDAWVWGWRHGKI